MGKWFDKVNSSPNQMRIKKALEDLGHTNVEVWWETIGPAPEMCMPTGGFLFCSDQQSINPLGYSTKEALDFISKASWFKVSS